MKAELHSRARLLLLCGVCVYYAESATLILVVGLPTHYCNAQVPDKSPVPALRFEEVKGKAERGDADAQYNLGLAYDTGAGVTKNVAEAARWFGRAADLGYAPAQYNLGFHYSLGSGVAQDDVAAVKWFRKAADQGYMRAQSKLALAYTNGTGVAKDEAEAAKWRQKAADQRTAQVQYDHEYKRWEDKALADFPDINVPGTPLFNAVKAASEEIVRTNAPLRYRPDCAYLLAASVAKKLGIAAVTPQSKAEPQEVASDQQMKQDSPKFIGLDAQWRAEALRVYPDAGVEGSPLFVAINNQVGRAKAENDPIWNLPDRAFLITARAAHELGIAPLAAKSGSSAKDPVFEHEALKAQIAQRQIDKEQARQANIMAEERARALAYRLGDMSVLPDLSSPEALMAAPAQVPGKSPALLFQNMKADAERGDAVAQWLLGIAYSHAQGVARDTVKAVKWFRKAADQGLADAQLEMGGAYAEGEGVPTDVAVAAKWYRKAAEQGNATAQHELGYAYAEGEGVPKDVVQAYKWYNLSAAGDADALKQLVEDAKRERTRLEGEMTPEQIAEAQKLSREFMPQ